MLTPPQRSIRACLYAIERAQAELEAAEETLVEAFPDVQDDDEAGSYPAPTGHPGKLLDCLTDAQFKLSETAAACLQLLPRGFVARRRVWRIIRRRVTRSERAARRD